jgi:DNA-binding MarR family transcriptional regulator
LATRRKARGTELSAAEYETIAAFRYMLRRFLAATDRNAALVGLTQQQYLALLVIRADTGVVTIRELADRMLVKHHSAVGLTDRLVRLGLIRRERVVGDRRRVALRFTPHGTRVFSRLANAQREELRRVGPDLGRFMAFFAGPSKAR